MEAPAWNEVFQGVAWTGFNLALVPLLPWSAFCRHLVWVYAQARATVDRLRHSWLYSFLEIAAMLSVPVVAVMWLLEASDRIKARHYRAWELINSARGSTGDGGRKAALQDLKEDGVRLSYAPLDKAYLAEIDLRGAHLWGAQLQEAQMWKSKLDDAILVKAQFHNAKLQKAELRCALLMQADFQGEETDLKEAKLHRANLFEAKLNDADLRGAELYGADLRGAQLQGAKLDGAHLEGAVLWGIVEVWSAGIFSYRVPKPAIINQEQINVAFGDENTVLPPDLNPTWLKAEQASPNSPPCQSPQPEPQPDTPPHTAR